MQRVLINWLTKFIVVSFFIAQPTLWGQNHSIIEDISTRQIQVGKTELYSPFRKVEFNTLNQDEAIAVTKNLSHFTLLRLNREVLHAIYMNQSHAFRMELPVEGQKMELILMEHKIFSEESRILTSEDPNGIKPVRARHFKGVVAGIDGSLVAMSFFSDEIMGVVSLPERGNLNIAVLKSHSGEEHSNQNYISFYESDLIKKQEYQCGVEEPGDASSFLHNMVESQTIFDTRCRTVRVFLECDYKMLQDRNLQVSQVVNYVTGLFNVVKTLYAAERVNLEISDIMVWTTPDPFPKTTLQNILLAYANYRRNNFNGDLAQLLSTATAQQQGGIAFVNGMCTNWNGQLGPLSYAWINNTFQQLPIYSWSVEVMAHELGHNFGSWHTHSCVWGPAKNSQIDNCQPPDVGSCPPGPAPVGGGTIMSYCHLSSYGINFSKGFGKEPGDVLRNAINTKTCLQAKFNATQQVNLQGPYFDGDVIKLQAKPVDANYTYDWFHHDYKMPGKNDSFLDVKYSGIYTAAVSDNCTEYAASDTLDVEEFRVNLGCPVKPGRLDSVFQELKMMVDNSEIRDSFVFPAGLFGSIPPYAQDLMVEIQHGITAKGTSWARSVLTSYTSPSGIGIYRSNFKPGENVAFGEKNTVWFSRSLGRFDPAGKWVFTAIDDRTDLGIDAELQIKVVLKWRMPDTIPSCEIPLCKREPLQLTANIPGGQYRWSHGPLTRTVDITSAGTYTLTVTKNNKLSQHTIIVKEYETLFAQYFQICEGEFVAVATKKYLQTGTYFDTLLSSVGCDSIIRTEIEVLPVSQTEEEKWLCYGELYRDVEYFEDSTLSFIYRATNGCDSIHLVKLKVHREVLSGLVVYPACEDIGAKVEATPSGGMGNIEVLWHTGSKELSID
ncbi:MAG: hypothetical protein IPM48_00970 [Saprospiraceae bacterium]|nr:hypothetical protein [Saprospiraceae bacterium]